MSNLITRTEYATISQNLASALESIELAKDFAYDNVYTLVISDNIVVTYDLHNTFYEDYQKAILLSNTNATFLNGVRALQRHVLSKGGYGTVNDFLDDQEPPLTVPSKFATISILAGFNIDNLATETNSARTRIVD
jgi:hypothetical protein